MTGGSSPKISIITPSFNQGATLEETIRSVISQNYPNLEYIIMDGGSTDKSVDIIRRYEKYLAFWVSEKDKGQTHAINKGIQKATGEIIAWINSDDFYYPGALDIISQAYNAHPNAGLYIGNGTLVDKNGQKIRRYSQGVAFDFNTLLRGSNYILQQATFINKKALDKLGLLDETLHYTMDLEFWLRVGKQYPVITIDEELAAYRWSEEIKTASGGLERWVEQWHTIRRFTKDQLTIGLLVEFFSVLQEKKVLESLNVENLDKFAREHWLFFYNAMQEILHTRDCIPTHRSDISFTPRKHVNDINVKIWQGKTIRQPNIVSSLGSQPKIDVVLPKGHSWFVRGGYVEALKHFHCFGKEFYVSEKENLTELFNYLKSPKSDFIFLLNTDWHAQYLHKTSDWQNRWNECKTIKILFSFECMNNPTVKRHSRWLSDTLNAVDNAMRCVNGLVFAHEIDEELFKNYDVPFLWQPFAIDEEIFPEPKEYAARKRRAFFRGKAETFYFEETYSSRRRLMGLLKTHPDVDVFEGYNFDDFVEGGDATLARNRRFIQEMNEYQITLSLPSLSPTMVVRPLEAMASGSVAFQNRILGERTNKLFEDHKNIVVYEENDPKGLTEKIEYILSNPDLGRQIARNGYEDVMEKHTIKNRVAEVIKWIAHEPMLAAVSSCQPSTVSISPGRADERAVTHSETSESSIKAKPSGGKILIDGVIFYLQKDRPAGIYRVWKALLQELAHSPFADSIVLLDRNFTAPAFPGIRKIPANPYDYKNFEHDSLYLEDICRRENASLFISTYYTYPENSPAMIMLHDMVPEIMGMDLTQPEWRAKERAIEKANAYFSVSQSTANDFRKIFPQYAAKKIYLTPNAVSDNFRRHTSRDIQTFMKKYDIRKPYFMFVGHRLLYKNAILLFRAFSLLENRSDLELLFTGGEKKIDSIFHPYLKETKYHHLFLTADDELSTAYSGALALVYPSRYEGFGLPILEAMKSGCPVITCLNSSIPEVAGDAALYVDEADVAQMMDALTRMQRPEIREDYIGKGFENVKRFSWQKTDERIVAALTEIMNELKDAPLNPSGPIDTVGRLLYMLNKCPGWNKLQPPLAQLDQLFLGRIRLDHKTLTDSEKAVAGMETDAFDLLRENMDNITEKNYFIDYLFGLALEKRGLLQKAFEAYFLAMKNWRSAYRWRPAYLAADSAYRLGHPDTARQLLTQIVLKEYPNYDEALKILRAINDAAGANYSSPPVTKKPGGHESRGQSGREAAIREGDMLFRQKKYSQAKKVFEDYLKNNPGDPEVASRLEKIVSVEKNIRALNHAAKKHFT